MIKDKNNLDTKIKTINNDIMVTNSQHCHILKSKTGNKENDQSY